MPEPEPGRVIPLRNAVGVASIDGTSIKVVHRFPQLWPLASFVFAALGWAEALPSGASALLGVGAAIMWALQR